jgi:glycosyltransferase involved in cell wall biosynthesis
MSFGQVVAQRRNLGPATCIDQMPTRNSTLLCVCNYPANTGYAWDFIESLYAGIATRLAPLGVRTLVAYPRIDEPPKPLSGSPAQAVELDATLRTAGSIRATVAFVRREGIKAVYFTDHAVRSTAYLRLRRAGVRRVIVHDHSSGERSPAKGPRAFVKWLLARIPGILADDIIAVSDYVARRHTVTGMIPVSRVVRVWNGMTVPPPGDVSSKPLHQAFGVEPGRPIVACACRAAPEKGVPVLLQAFDLVVRRRPRSSPRPLLVFMGDGPDMARIRSTHEHLEARADIVLAGYRADALTLLPGATICAMPSVWQDALPLAVMQPMALGLPVIASRVGGIPEMIIDEETGLLVPPSNPEALAAALERLLDDPQYASRLGRAARDRISTLFTLSGQLDMLAGIAIRGLSGDLAISQ